LRRKCAQISLKSLYKGKIAAAFLKKRKQRTAPGFDAGVYTWTPPPVPREALQTPG
jgi:hypothetical protein